MKSEGMADTDHLNVATQKFTQKSGHNSEELPRGSKNVRAIGELKRHSLQKQVTLTKKETGEIF